MSIFGLDVLIMLVNYALAQRAILLYDRFKPNETCIPVQTALAARWLIGVGVATVVWIGLSLALFRTPTTPTVRVAAIQLARPPSPSFSSDEELRQFLENHWRRLIDDSQEDTPKNAVLGSLSFWRVRIPLMVTGYIAWQNRV